MDHIKVLKRAFKITWDYRALWIFGIILALTVGSFVPQSPSPNGGDSDRGDGPVTYVFTEEELPPEWAWLKDISEETWIAIGIGVGTGCLCLFLLWIVVCTIARWVAETALIRMVDDYEETNEKRSIREGFRMGWSRSAFRLFLIDLLVNLPIAVVFILLFLAVGALFVLAIVLLEADIIVLGVIIIIAAIGLFFLLMFAAIIVGLVVNLPMPFFLRACALEGLGVIDSIRAGFNFVKRHLLWDIAIMWLLLFGLGFAWSIASFIIMFLLLIAGAVLVAAPLLLIGGLGSLVIGWPAWLVAGLIALPLFLLVVIVPAVLLRGLEMTLTSTLWTLTYRELRALGDLEAESGETPEELPEDWPEDTDV